MTDARIDGKGEFAKAFDLIATKASQAMSQVTNNPQQAANTLRDLADQITDFADAQTDTVEGKPTAEGYKGDRIDVV